MKTNLSIESRKGYVNKHGPIDCNDDLLMVHLGLRQPILVRHPELHIKTKFEKEELKRLKSNCTPISRKSPTINSPREYIMGRLTVYLKNIEKSSTFKTTRSFKCFKNEVEDILEGLRNDKLIVNKYYFKY